MIVELSFPVFLAVAVGGALGAVSRYLLDAYMRAGVLIANTLGSLLIGALIGLSASGAVTFSSVTLGVASLGFIGALSTFSTVSLRAAELWTAQRRFKAIRLWLAHTGLGLAAAAGGAWAGWVLTL